MTPSVVVPADPDCYVDGKVDYTRLREKSFFQSGIARLQTAFTQQRRVVLMCSEGRPEECHRSKLIGATLDTLGIPVCHIDEADHSQTQAAVIDRLTNGQLGLFGQEEFTSRKRYRPNPEAEEGRTKMIEFVTIGVYGFDATTFFAALQNAKVDTFCDIRRRRAVRGAAYAFANHQRLEARLVELGIRYLHYIDLAPTTALRGIQDACRQSQKNQEAPTPRPQLCLHCRLSIRVHGTLRQRRFRRKPGHNRPRRRPLLCRT